MVEIRLEAGRHMEAFIACPAAMIPPAGKYLLASDPEDTEEALGTAVFNAETAAHGFWAAAPIPAVWRPGTTLDLIGPLGHGFDLPREVQRLGLAALGESMGRLMPLVRQAGQSSYGITLFTDLALPALPSSLEAYPLSSLKESLDWPDFMAIDLPLARLPELRSLLGVLEGKNLPFPTQVLMTTPMPCAGLAQCGACAVPARRGWKLACEDGPVFDLDTLNW